MAGGGDPRESATENKPPAQEPQGVPRARAKRCGKSAPRPWQQGRQGKPHREQDRIGAAVPQGTGAFPPRRPGWSREARCEARPRGMVVPRSRATWGADRTRLTGRLASFVHTSRRHHPYSVLLPVGFTMPLLLPGARCALAAPFRPCPRGALRHLARAVCFLWHFPWGRPRRSLAGTVFPWSPDFPLMPCGISGRPAVWRGETCAGKSKKARVHTETAEADRGPPRSR